MPIKTQEEIKSYYKKSDIAKGYVDYRFKTPIGFVEHKRQLNFINKSIIDNNIKSIFEIGCGPARLTAELAPIKEGFAIDSSEEMLEIAKSYKLPNWDFEKANVFDYNPSKKYDLVIAFRFLFHFHKEDREKIYALIKKSMKKNGRFIFEVKNRDKAERIKRIIKIIYGKKQYKVYQKLYTFQEIKKELEMNGLKIVRANKVINHFYKEAIISKIYSFLNLRNKGIKKINKLEKKQSKNPLYWTIECQLK